MKANQTLEPVAQNYAELADAYRRDGYVIARQLVPASTVQAVFADMHKLVVQQLNFSGLPFGSGSGRELVHADLKTLFQFDRERYIATLTLCAKLVSLYELYMHSSVREVISAIGIALPAFQTAPVMHLMSRALKIPDGYQGFGAHQDWPTLQGGLDTVTIWIPFVPVDGNSYTLEIIPGSHLGGLYSYSRRDHIFELDADCYDAQSFIPVEAEPGDMVFMSSFSIHRSGTKGDDRLRVSTSMRYENAAEDHFIARAYPFGQKRTVVKELITPNFPSVDQVKKTFGHR